MAALAWLINLDFAGGGTVTPPPASLPAEVLRVQTGTLMRAIARNKRRKRKVLNSKMLFRWIKFKDAICDTKYVPKIVKEIEELIVKKSLVVNKFKDVRLFNNVERAIEVKKQINNRQSKSNNIEDELTNIIKFRRKNNDKKPTRYFEVNNRNKVVSLFSK